MLCRVFLTGAIFYTIHTHGLAVNMVGETWINPLSDTKSSYQTMDLSMSLLPCYLRVRESVHVSVRESNFRPSIANPRPILKTCGIAYLLTSKGIKRAQYIRKWQLCCKKRAVWLQIRPSSAAINGKVLKKYSMHYWCKPEKINEIWL